MSIYKCRAEYWIQMYWFRAKVAGVSQSLSKPPQRIAGSGFQIDERPACGGERRPSGGELCPSGGERRVDGVEQQAETGQASSWADIFGEVGERVNSQEPNRPANRVPLPNVQFGGRVARPNTVLLHTQAFKDISVREVMGSLLKCVRQDTIKCLQHRGRGTGGGQWGHVHPPFFESEKSALFLG
jgi:hypothetical protein